MAGFGIGDISITDSVDSKESVSWGGLSIYSEDLDEEFTSVVTLSELETLVNIILPRFTSFANEEWAELQFDTLML